MSSVNLELEQALHQLDARSATLLEQLVRNALALVGQNGRRANGVDAKGWPVGYFERTAGSFAGEPLDLPDDAHQPQIWTGDALSFGHQHPDRPAEERVNRRPVPT